ncbi:WG repeat-containing protein [Desulfuribacillus alkaliarsenatis]|uniref:DUF3298 domain-containing protein n=1 Tax=Desulfuribacillus alkaliarsenatis TaxID=766136 RepID=A0A1E5G312_9FIRM|nr:WG repeat-containing protein [Desulfuribacillus alkaliarsenatis]OEF97462.1 hypothetical protein BHF68_04450 [Desulfuribacillus alkaliarsenatis]
MFQQIAYENIIKAHLPIGAELVVSTKDCSRALVFAVDIDGDGCQEVVGGYRFQEQMHLMILKKHVSGWYVLATIEGKGYNVNYCKVAPITGKNVNNLVVGWKVGVMWSELAIYTWTQNKLVNIAPESMYFSNIEVNPFTERGIGYDAYKVALWKHDTGDAYQVDVWSWKDDKLVQAYDVYPAYFKKVVKYYTVLTQEFPQSPVYWYYLADAQYKTGMLEEALTTLETAQAFENSFPSREVLESLEKRILSKIDSVPTNNSAIIEAENVIEINLFPASMKTTRGSKWGYIDKEGIFVIEPKYHYAMDFQANGLAVIEDASGLSGLINMQGEYIIKPTYNMITSFREGRASAVDNTGYWLIDEQGKMITKKAYNYIGTFYEGRALYTDIDKQGNYLYGYLDRQGSEVIPMKYRSGTDFNEGRAVVQVDDKRSALIGLNGEVYQTYPYSSVGSYSDGLLKFQEQPGGKFGYINAEGEVIIKPKYTWAQDFADGKAIVTNQENYKNRTGLIDKQGKYIVEPRYNSILDLKEERYAVGKAIDEEQPFIGSLYALADTEGNILTDYLYRNVMEYGNGVASVNDGERTFFIDLQGQKVKDLPSISGTGTMELVGNESLVKVNIDMRIFYLKPTGEIVWRQNSVIPLKGNYRVLEKKYMPNKDYLVYLPIIEGMKSKKKQDEVNKRLKKLSNVKPIDGDKQLDYSYNGDFSIEYYKMRLLVLELNGYHFPFGAAHGMPSKTYPHVDLVTGEFYKLEDLFKQSSNYVKALSDIIAEQIKTDPQYSYVFPDSFKGIKPDQPFYVSRDILHIYFAPYEIAPYVAGFPTFKIPFREIDDIINKRGSFWRAFHKLYV